MNKSLWLLLIAGILLISGCGQQSIPKQPPEPAAQIGNEARQNTNINQQANQQPQTNNGTDEQIQRNIITIENMRFDPASFSVAVGTAVTWINKDSVPHQVASDPHPSHTDLPGLSSPVLSNGERYTFTFNRVGTFGYHCHLHPSMRSTIIVQE